jgi:hypothetical protein
MIAAASPRGRRVEVPHTYHVLKNADDTQAMHDDVTTKVEGAGGSLRELTFDSSLQRAYATVDYESFDVSTVKRVTDALSPLETRILLDLEETVGARGG